LWFLSVLSFFSITGTGRTDRPILTLYGPNDVFRRKDVPFGGRTINDVISGKCAPKPLKVGVNRQIQAKMRKSKNRTISEIVNPIKPPFEDIAATINFVGGLPLPRSKSNMTGGRHLKIAMTSQLGRG